MQECMNVIEKEQSTKSKVQKYMNINHPVEFHSINYTQYSVKDLLKPFIYVNSEG